MITTLACFAAITALAALAIVAGLLRSARLDAAAHTRSASLLQQQFLTDARLERQRLLDALSDAFLLVDSAATIRFANAAALELFDHRELVHRPVSETLLDPRLANALRHCLESGEPVHARVVLPQQASPRGDLENRGSNAWSIDAARLPAFENEPTLTRVILRDLTAEYQTDQIRKDFVANASHELRTPMAIIHGYLENLLDDNLLDEPATARHFLAIMRKHSERISRIVEDMLVISRLESGEAGSLKIEPFPLRSCIADVLERLESVVRNQNALIHVAIPDESLVMHGDRYYWTQVLFNLVENALKQNPKPGLHIEIGAQQTISSCQVWVLDNGIGIPSADLPHIFRRFYRVDKHHSQREIKGTGLGLSIVKRAIDAHGGSIGVTSVPGRETRFLITVPTAPAHGETAGV